MNNNNIDPFQIELLDVLNEVGGIMKIKYHTKILIIQKEGLQTLRNHGYSTDVMTCIVAGLAASGMKQQEITSFLKEADAVKSAPNVTFEAAEGEALNIKSREENPMVDMLLQAL